MPSTLTATAEYYPKVKSLQVILYLADETAYHPEILTVGTAELRKGTFQVGQILTFLPQHATSEGWFKLFWSRVDIPDMSDVKVYLRLQTREGVITQTVSLKVTERNVFEETLPESSDTQLIL